MVEPELLTNPRRSFASSAVNRVISACRYGLRRLYMLAVIDEAQSPARNRPPMTAGSVGFWERISP
jgi:hypothetical protein